MDIRTNLMELEEAAKRISDGLAALQIMAVGLEGLGKDYAGALYAIYDYCSDADLEFKKCLDACMKAV